MNKIEIINGQKTIKGNVDLSDQSLSVLPDLSDVIILGGFYCDRNKLTSLQGAPESVGGGFYCDQISDKYYREYIEQQKILRLVNTETKELFAELIETL